MIIQKGKFGRDSLSSIPSLSVPGNVWIVQDITCPLSIVTSQMTDTMIDRVKEDAKLVEKSFFIKDKNGNVVCPKAGEENS